jgi:hypothetical protein
MSRWYVPETSFADDVTAKRVLVIRPVRRCSREALLTELITWLRIYQAHASFRTRRNPMGGLIYLIGLIVVVMFILSFLGLR